MKRLFAIIIVLVCLNGMAFCQKKSAGQVKTIVIDAGHGGAKPGAIGRQSQEKNLTLSMALKLGEVIKDNYPDVKIIYTRTSDVDIALAERARIANRAKADLFLSIHCNSWANNTPTGVETYVMGLSQSKANMQVAKKENADILLEEGYKDNSDYQGFDPNSPESYVMFAMYQNAYLDKSLDFAGLIQQQYKQSIKTIDRGVKQAEIFVLYKTAMPAVLTEVGFISNPEEEQYMMSDEGQATIVASIFKAFAAYKSQTEGTKMPTNLKINLKGYQEKPRKMRPNEVEVPADTTPQTTTSKATEKAKPAQSPATSTEAVSAFVPSTANTRVQPPLPMDEPAETVPVTKKQTCETKDTTPNTQSQITPQQTPQTAPCTDVVFKVQFMTSGKKLKDGAREFKGVSDYECYLQNGTYCYTAGRFKTARDAANYQKEIRSKGFNDAFVVAFQGDQRISLQKAKELGENK